MISTALRRPFQAGLFLTGAITLACSDRRAEPGELATLDSIDPRTPVVLSAEAQQAVLREMRGLLGALGGAMAAAAHEDTTALVAALAPAGRAAAADPALEALLPAGWKDLAERTHRGFDDLAATVRRIKGTSGLKDTVLVTLARLSGVCTSCHEAYRVTIR